MNNSELMSIQHHDQPEKPGQWLEMLITAVNDYAEKAGYKYSLLHDTSYMVWC